MHLTQPLLMQIMRHASLAKLGHYVAPLNRAMQDFDITTLRRAAAFIAQLAHESGEFRFMEEVWGPTDAQRRYEPPSRLAERLGNVEAGDGERFKGRGPIQITGRANYARYGDLLQVELLQQPELAATPEIGFRIAALFWQKNGLNARADRDDFDAITQRINGGRNGQAERERFYRRALEVLAPVFPAGEVPAAAAPATGASLPRGAEAVREEGQTRATAAPMRRKLDARADTMDFRDRMFVPTLVEVPTHVPLGNYLDVGVPILDQGSEGACTGYGLATIVHYLLRRRRVLPDTCPVSARMLYLLARRYDEWPGEDYSGSSARGAMKGWHKHGVCAEELYPSRNPDIEGLTDARTAEARRRPLGAYFRVNHRDLVAMHAAIAEVGILYATAVVHEGWRNVGPDGAIVQSDKVLGGHAFAIVAYDDEGFWLQNSWGPGWGKGGFARVSYDDWFANGTDVWVARLGAPVTLRALESTATAHASMSGESIAYTYADLRPHIVRVGNDGWLRDGGDYGMNAPALGHIFEHDLPRVTEGWPTVRVLLYAHGGLVDEASAVQRLAEYRPALLDGEVYPLAFIWRSDYWTTVSNILSDAIRRRRPEGPLDAAKDFMLDRLDDALEPVARMLTGRAAWKEMKENALGASEERRAAWLVVEQLAEAARAPWLQGRALEIHLVGHSAGSILHAGVVSRLIDKGLPIASCTLWAPACTVKLFNRHYAPAIRNGHVGRFNLYALRDEAERDDHCAGIYHKSLLYLVSHAFEEHPRIPGSSKHAGEAILGMERWLTAEIRALFGPGSPHRLILAPNDETPASGRASKARHHGDFDDDRPTVLSTFAGITGAAPATPAEEKMSGAKTLAFEHNGSALRERRLHIDNRTAPAPRS